MNTAMSMDCGNIQFNGEIVISDPKKQATGGDVCAGEGTVICRLPCEDDNNQRWGVFQEPLEVISTYDVTEVTALLSVIESKVEKGNYAAGFISYEAAPAFDEANTVKEIDDFPLLWFGIYHSSPLAYSSEDIADINLTGFSSKVELPKRAYLSSVKKIGKYIREGDIYQANYTFRSKLDFSENAEQFSPYKLFRSLFKSHPVPYAAYVNTGKEELVSISPELFLEKNGRVLRSIPMKGTAHRKLNAKEDLLAADELSKDPKNRAENIMIVDMVRNDLGRLCCPGSIKASPICHVDTYNTVHQMITSVKGVLPEDISLPDIFSATFPAASITGAPKIRAMQIIDELELSPRKAYTGSIGCVLPGGDFSFNVAIRTLIYSDSGVELGIGSGVVADSIPEDEWKESLLKSTFVSKQLPGFELLETILWTAEKGFIYLDEHLKRLQDSHRYFMWNWDYDKVLQRLKEELQVFTSAKFARIRLRSSQNGNVSVEVYPLDKPGWGKDFLKIKISRDQTDSGDVFLFHKTTNRDFYNNQFKQALNEGFDEVIFVNEKNEITEGAISNIFIRKKEQWITPAVSSGLLEGVWRAAKIAELNAEERILNIDDLKNADEIMLGNSVRGGARCTM